MKKLLSLMVCFGLALGMSAIVGCGDTPAKKDETKKEKDAPKKEKDEPKKEKDAK